MKSVTPKKSKVGDGKSANDELDNAEDDIRDEGEVVPGVDSNGHNDPCFSFFCRFRTHMIESRLYAKKGMR